MLLTVYHTEVQINLNSKITLKDILMLREPETSIFTRLDQILDLTSKKNSKPENHKYNLVFFFFFLSKYGEYVRISLIF